MRTPLSIGIRFLLGRFLALAGLLGMPLLLQGAVPPAPGAEGREQRAYQVAVLVELIRPVLEAGAEGKLAQALPSGAPERADYAPLEALARSLTGAAPWLELGPGEDEEGRQRAHYLQLALASLRSAVDPSSPGYLNFSKGAQPLVDTAFLAQALLRAPHQLWGNLSERERQQVVAALKVTRVIKPNESNWLLFSAMVEAALLEFTGDCDRAPIEKAISKHLEWYKGDGSYGDGAHFHWDYYNSFVIQPMLLEVLEVCARHGLPQAVHLPKIQVRFTRYAQVQERLISPEGSFPVLGRSAVYRFAAFQTLALAALRHQLPATCSPGAVRAALTAVISRTLSAPSTFDARGWLQMGVLGHQAALAESYISPGSVYLCTVGLLQLGLPANDPFWTVPDESWTQRRIWAGEEVPADHAIVD